MHARVPTFNLIIFKSVYLQLYLKMFANSHNSKTKKIAQRMHTNICKLGVAIWFQINNICYKMENFWLGATSQLAIWCVGKIDHLLWIVPWIWLWYLFGRMYCVDCIYCMMPIESSSHHQCRQWSVYTQTNLIAICGCVLFYAFQIWIKTQNSIREKQHQQQQP